MKFYFLSNKFYSKYSGIEYEQIEKKKERPYIHVPIPLNNDVVFYIPLRSNINHPHVFFTDKNNRCGLDYTKAVIIEDDEYIDWNTTPHIRNHEFKRLLGKEYKIKIEFLKYVKMYLEAKCGMDIPHAEDILKYSTLQYFEKYLNINSDEQEKVPCTPEREPDMVNDLPPTQN